MSTPEKLDKELRHRMDELAVRFTQKGEDIVLPDVFENKYVLQAMKTSKVILPSYDIREILANFPFAEALCVAICPHCGCVGKRKDLLKLLERQAITPILFGSYSSYPIEFVNDILSFPHASFHEFMFFRFASLISHTKTGACPHCVEARRKELFQLCRNAKHRDLLKHCFGDLHPFIGHDLALLDVMDSALRNDDSETLFQLSRLVAMIRDLRTAQAYEARLLTEESVDLISVDPSLAEKVGIDLDANFVTDILTQNLGITVPKGIDVNKFLDIYEPYRKQITDIVHSVVEESISDGRVSVSKLSTLLSDLNGQISEISKKPGYLLYRASLGFAKSNKALIGGALLAGALGLTGHFAGCGISVFSGIGAHFYGKKLDVKIPSEAKRLASLVKKRLREPVQKLLARYLDVDVRAVQICEMKKNLKDG